MTPEEIMEIRKKLCVSQEKFAQLLGTTVVTVNRWENGKTAPSRLYIKELKELRSKSGSYVCRRKENEKS
jgi:DNA-binding transcriptional regulator YiaG